MNKLWLLFFLSFPILADDRIVTVITTLSPHVSKAQATEYAAAMSKYSEQYDVDWRVAAAIFKQESDFKMGEVNETYRDFGMGQINYRNIKVLNLDLARLLTDVDYTIHQTYRILHDLKQRYNHGYTGYKQWFTRYHSFTLEFRKLYWHGTKKTGTDGLAYKLEVIDKVLKKYERSAQNRNAQSSGAQPGRPGSKGVFGQFVRSGAPSPKVPDKKRLYSRVHDLARPREDVWD